MSFQHTALRLQLIDPILVVIPKLTGLRVEVIVKNCRVNENFFAYGPLWSDECDGIVPVRTVQRIPNQTCSHHFFILMRVLLIRYQYIRQCIFSQMFVIILPRHCSVIVILNKLKVGWQNDFCASSDDGIVRVRTLEHRVLHIVETLSIVGPVLVPYRNFHNYAF